MVSGYKVMQKYIHSAVNRNKKLNDKIPKYLIR